MLVNVSLVSEPAEMAHIGELQLHLDDIFRLKPAAHVSYGITRGLALDDEAIATLV